MSLVKWMPMLSSSLYSDIVNSYAGDVYGHNLNWIYQNSINPNHYIQKLSDGYELNFELPGLSKDCISVDIKDSNLIISTSEHNDNNKSFWYGGKTNMVEFHKEFSLPENINIKGISANYNNGLLKINIPINNRHIGKSKSVKIK